MAKKKVDLELTRVYSEIALEREHVCTGCGVINRLSHSHLIPRGDKNFWLDKRNIQYHCLSMGEVIGCHQKWESVDFWQLNDAYDNMKFIFAVRPDLFWLKLNHAIDAYENASKKLPAFPLGKKERQRIDDVNKALVSLEKIKHIADAQTHSPT